MFFYFEGGREQTMSFGNVVNQLHDKHRLSHSCTSEKTNLASTLVWRQQIHDLQKPTAEISFVVH